MQEELKREILKQIINQITIRSREINATPYDFNVFFPNYSGENVHKKINPNEYIVFKITSANSFKGRGSLLSVFET